MTLLPDWQDILKRAWSIRLLVLSTVLTGIEIILPMFELQMPQFLFGIAMLVITIAAFVSRLMVQKEKS